MKEDLAYQFIFPREKDVRMDPQKRQILLQNIKLYDSALAAWEKKDLAEARRLLNEM